MRVALVHDWLTGMRGGEKVLDAFAELWPDADLFTLFADPDRLSPRLESDTIVGLVGWAKARRAVPTNFLRSQRMVGTLRFAHPCISAIAYDGAVP